VTLAMGSSSGTRRSPGGPSWRATALLHAFGVDVQTWGNPAYSTGNLDALLLG
jgi:hypothetical protein